MAKNAMAEEPRLLPKALKLLLATYEIKIKKGPAGPFKELDI